MLFPQPADGRGVEQAVGFHSGRIQEMLRPVPQRAAQPFGDGNGEALLRPVAKLGGQITVEELAQRPFARAVAAKHLNRQPRSEERRVGKERVSTCRYGWLP